MGKSWRPLDVIINLIFTIGLVFLWIYFAPAQAGGQASYVLVNGISMEPGFHKGDLAILRKAEAYAVGDIVTYRDAKMNANVIHRIIEIAQDRFVLKGDNNYWIDGYQPTQEEIVGKLWLHLPKMGDVMQWIRLPLTMSLAVGLLGGLFMLNNYLPKPVQKGKRKHPPAGGGLAGWFETALTVSGTLALIFLALLVFSLTRPTTRSAENIAYEQTGTFFYSASGDPSIYDHDSIRSGEPVFTRVSCTLDLGFQYTLMGPQPEGISGVQQMRAVILDNLSGWKRTLPLTDITAFNGNAITNTAVLDLCKVQELVAAVEEKTGFRQPSYTLDITSDIAVTGSLAGQVFSDTFEPHLTFKFDGLHFYLEGDNSRPDPMTTVLDSSLFNSAEEDNTFKVFGLEIPVSTTRFISLIGLVITLGGLVALGVYYYSMSTHSPAAVNRIKYGAMLIDVYDHGLLNLGPVIEVAALDDLAKLAERQSIMILHLAHDRADYYIVQLESAIYRYVARKKGGER